MRISEHKHLLKLNATDRKLVTRFAPSPTGHLHLGHIVNAIYVWGIARAAGGTVVLRIEDHDRGRSRSEFESSILTDLAWLGFVPDLGLTTSGDVDANYRQSSHPERYEAALGQLQREHHVYYCECSRKQIRDAAPVQDDEEPRYPGTCRHQQLPHSQQSSTRLELPAASVDFVDALTGTQHTQTPTQQCGDLLLRDRDQYWTYQFAVTVDDLHDGITHVIRGVDILSSTGRQILLRQLLGNNAPPKFLHHTLLHDPTGRKLSKRDEDLGVRHLRSLGKSPADVIGEAAFLAGLQSSKQPIPADAVRSFFI